MPGVLSKCSACKEDVAPGAEVKISGTNIRCRPCNNLHSRLHRMRKSLKVDGFEDLNSDERTQFMKDAADLYGAGLQKLLTETVTRSQITRSTVSFAKGGNYEPLEDFEERLKDKPDELAYSLQHCSQMKCPDTGRQLILIPNYTQNQTNENILENNKKRKVEAESKIKKPKVPKEEPEAPAALAAGGVVETVKQKPPSPLSEQHETRLTKLLQRLAEVKMELTTTTCMAMGPNMEEYVPRHFIPKSDKNVLELDRCSALMQTWITTKTTPKGEVPAFIKEVTGLRESTKALRDQIQSLVDLQQTTVQ